MSKSAAARTFGVSRQSIDNWLSRVRADGPARGLAAQKRGPKPRPRMRRNQEREVVRLIRGRCPDQLLLPFALWSRAAVVQLLNKRYGQKVSVWTAGRYLKRWGLTPQKPLRRAYERDPAEINAWLTQEYPSIKTRAKVENALILWGDEMGLRSDDQIGRSYAPRGQTPVVSATGRRFGCNMISVISNLGQLWFMVFAGRLDAAMFVRFLNRLLRAIPDRKLFLIIDSHPAHKAAKTARWAQQHADRIELLYLPGYCPELNPDELLNNDTKQAMRQQRTFDQSQMMANVRGHLRRRQKQPQVVKRFFEQKDVRYAAA